MNRMNVIFVQCGYSFSFYKNYFCKSYGAENRQRVEFPRNMLKFLSINEHLKRFCKKHVYIDTLSKNQISLECLT